MSKLIRAGLLTGVTDGLFSAVFLAILAFAPRVRRAIATPAGVAATAAWYGPAIWLVMSLAVIPLLLQRPPVINVRWWVQLIGHFPFVGFPIVAACAGGTRPQTQR